MSNELGQDIIFDPTPKPIKGIVEFLRGRSFDPKKEFYEFEISGEIEAVDLRTLTTLSYEIALTERGNRVILSTGTEEGVGEQQPDLLGRMRHSRLHLHTHHTGGTQPTATAPSFADAGVATHSDPTTPQLVAHNSGITLFTAPTFNPLTNEPYNCRSQGVRDLILFWGRAHGIDTFGFGLDPGLKDIFKMPVAEVNDLAEKFAKETRMILKEVSWEDNAGIAEMMRYVNLKL